MNANVNYKNKKLYLCVILPNTALIVVDRERHHCFKFGNIRLIRLMSKSGYLDHTENLFQSLNMLPFFHLIKYKIAIFMYEVYYKMLPLTTLNIFCHYYSYYLTRQRFTFLSYSRTSIRHQGIVYAGVHI